MIAAGADAGRAGGALRFEMLLCVSAVSHARRGSARRRIAACARAYLESSVCHHGYRPRAQ